MRTKAVILLTMGTIGLYAQAARANVSLKNGNFFIGYTDIVYPGGFDPKIERVYNAKASTSFKGIFGWGWGNEFEVFLKVAADGSVTVHEYGGGAENRFSPGNFNQADLDRAVEEIANGARAANLISGSADQFKKYKVQLKADASFRGREWEKLVQSGRLKPRALANGVQLQSIRFSPQYITKVAGGYIRVFESGKVERFNEQGKLVKVSDRNKNAIDLTYSKDGRIAKIVDNFNRKMFLSYNKQGLLERIEGENKKVASFQYSAVGELTYSKDVDGNAYSYKYDKNRNMNEIGYADKTTLQISYYGVDKNENVKTVKERDGTLTEYSYQYDSSDKNHYTVAVNVKSKEGAKLSSAQYEYFNKRRADGEEWQYKLIATLDGEKTETTYNESHGLPVSIKKEGEETTFDYDAKGHLTRKTTPTELTELSYDAKVGKVKRVTRQDRASKRQTQWSNFQYDGSGNMIFAENSEKKAVRLLYFPNGLIKTMVDNAKRRMDFKYDENSKPTQIKYENLGTITMSYTNSGEVKKIESSAGRKVASQVFTAFQNLLEIVRPAGVSLSF